tara:strand:- start:658 stop:1449 length:792 start_codon:yes stop_codon:yes gene_type:complete
MKKLLLILLCLPLIGFGQCEDRCNEIISYTNAKYTGCVNENNQEDGYGTLKFESGESYVGCWKDGMKDGEGVYEYSKDEKYIGEYRSDKRNGPGTYHYSDGSVWIGLWLDDKELEGHYESENYYDRSHISGDVDFSVINLNKLVAVDGEGCYNITLSFNGTNEDFLFDTGCSSMLINYEFLEKLKSNGAEIRQLSNSSGRTASNDEVLMSQVMINNIRVGEFTIDNLVFGVIEEGSLLCGLGLFKKFSNVEWDMNSSTLKLYQ